MKKIFEKVRSTWELVSVTLKDRNVEVMVRKVEGFPRLSQEARNRIAEVLVEEISNRNRCVHRGRDGSDMTKNKRM